MASPDIATIHIGNVEHPIIHVDNTKLMIRLTLFISLMIGPAVFFLCSWMNSDFASGEKLPVLFAFLVMGFESAWIVYGFGVLMNKAVHNNMDNGQFE